MRLRMRKTSSWTGPTPTSESFAEIWQSATSLEHALAIFQAHGAFVEGTPSATCAERMKQRFYRVRKMGYPLKKLKSDTSALDFDKDGVEHF